MEDWLKEAYNQLSNMPDRAKEVRELAEANLYFFARLVNPGYMYGSIHKELFDWMQEYTLFGRGQVSSNKFLMLPRAHLKSHLVATWTAWMVVRHPEITVLYVSATAELAITQLFAIKNILDSDMFRKYWPEFIHPEVGKRTKWTERSIIIDHPKRKKEGVRDATIKIAGLDTNTTGWHADVICADDLVVPENAYTEEGRNSVYKKSSQFTSIRNAGGFTLACGTRYHPNDIYSLWKEQVTEVYEGDEYIGTEKVWDIKEYAVEIDGIYLWPRRVRNDGKAYGFDPSTLARIKAEYIDRTQFYAQYYNDPNDPTSERISRDKFQYYNPRHLKKNGSRWEYNGNKLNVYAAVDFAYSLNSRADYTAIVVIGIDADKDIYVLDIDRFKANKTIEYFQHLLALHSKWEFKKLHAEVTAAQSVIVEDIKDYVKKSGMKLAIEEFRPSRVQGSKEERIAAVLEHRYENQEMWHLEGGWTDVLEDELVQARPPHDDIKDSLASAVMIAVAPMRSGRDKIADFFNPVYKTRFGGFV